MSEVRTMTFRDRQFRVQKGTTHPEYSFFCFEQDEADFRDKYWHPKAGDIVVDAGASYGAYTLTALAMGATVEAFEPEQSVRVDLRANLRLNEWSHVCRVWPLGLWSGAESIDMASYAPHWPAGTVSGPFDMMQLDALGLTQLNWLKLDIEGAEEHALRGAIATLKRCNPVVIVECHTFLDPKLTAKCRTLLESCGYSDFEEVPRDPCVFLIARPS